MIESSTLNVKLLKIKYENCGAVTIIERDLNPHLTAQKNKLSKNKNKEKKKKAKKKKERIKINTSNNA